MIYNYTSVYNILEKVFRDNDYSDDLPWEDAIEWTAEALDKIGAYPQYIRKITGDKDNPCLNITNFKAELPCDFHKLEQIAVNGKEARYAGYTFHHLGESLCCTIPNNPNTTEDLFPDNWGNTFTNLSDNQAWTALQGYTYDINDNYITLNVKEGKVCIAYLAYAIDKNGFPLIPDKVEYKEALSKYITMKLDYRLWRTGRIDDKVFQHSEREWAFYCAQAHGAAYTPNIDKLETLRRQLVKLIPTVQQHKVFFK